MSTIELTHRLAAILAADAVGFSRLMGADEQSALGELDANRALFRRHTEEHGGRIVDMAGDSVLAVFASAAGAVRAAIAAQAAVEERSAAVPEDRRMRYRVGVNLGEIMEKPTAKPSIVVLPFDNMPGDAEQEYFAEITEDIITVISKVSGMFVIARNSSFAYKGRAVNLTGSAAGSACGTCSRGACGRPGTGCGSPCS